MDETETPLKPLFSKKRGLLGWHIGAISEDQIAKVLLEESEYRVIEKRSGKRVFVLSFPELSGSEQELARAVLTRFQAKENAEPSNSHPFREAEKLHRFFNEFVAENGFEVEADQFEYLFGLLKKMAFGLWPLDPLLSNERLEEIAVIGVGLSKPVFVYDAQFGWLETNLSICASDFFRDLVNRMARGIGRRLSLQTPRINAVLENGSRLHAAIEPVSFSGPCLTIRKFKQNPFTPLDLIALGTLDPAMGGFLWMALSTDCSLLVCGNTGSGKTSTLNALFCFVPEDERIVVAEETPEIRLPHTHVVKLCASAENGVGMHSLILDSLRMRPDRVVVGEIRSAEEVSAFVDTLLAGQGKGSMATFHAQSAKEALMRMKTMGIMEMDLTSIDLVLVQKRVTRVLTSGKVIEERRIVELCEVCDQGAVPKLNCLFGFDFQQKQCVRRNESVKMREKIQNAFGFSDQEFENEWENRTEWLRANAGNGILFSDFFEEVRKRA